MSKTISHHIPPETLPREECFHERATGRVERGIRYMWCEDCRSRLQTRREDSELPHPTQEEPNDPMED